MWKFVLMLVCVLHMAVIQGSTFYEDCGIIEDAKRTRVVNGTVSSEGQWPWMAYIRFITNGMIFDCGGSLIGKRHILTSAGCVVDKDLKRIDPGLFNVMLGAHTRLKGGEQYRVAQVRIHPDFKLNFLDNIFGGGFEHINDIAVLILDRDVKRSKHVIPICLPDDYLRNETFYNSNAYVAGWGRTEYKGEKSDVLRWANVTIWKNDICRKVYSTSTWIDDNDICAGGVINQGRNICGGDYGVPLMVFNSRRWKVIGVAQANSKCDSENKPGIFTRVSNYLDWIKDQM